LRIGILQIPNLKNLYFDFVTLESDLVIKNMNRLQNMALHFLENPMNQRITIQNIRSENIVLEEFLSISQYHLLTFSQVSSQNFIFSEPSAIDNFHKIFEAPNFSHLKSLTLENIIGDSESLNTHILNHKNVSSLNLTINSDEFKLNFTGKILKLKKLILENCEIDGIPPHNFRSKIETSNPDISEYFSSYF
jgi:hypothetical protein